MQLAPQTLIRKLFQTEHFSEKILFEKQPSIYTFLNPVSYLDALKHKELFMEFDGIFADGGLLVKAIRMLYGKRVQRRSFDMTSMAPLLFEYAVKHNKSIAIVATKQELLERAVSIFRAAYPRINISYYRNGYFSDKEDMEQEARKITALNPDFLIVGMGVIMQEDFLLRVKRSGYQGVGFTCGGFIHQTAQDKKDYYPIWVNEHGLRYLYRAWKEPHTRKRYLKAAFVFPIRFLWEKLITH